MELHTDRGPVAVPESHDEMILRCGGDLQAIGKTIRRNNQRMVASGAKGLGETCKQTTAVVQNRCRATMDRFGGTSDAPAKRFGYALVSETNTEDGNRSGQPAHEFDADASLRGTARAGRQDNGPRAALLGGGNRQRVVAANERPLPQLFQVAG